MTVGDGDTGGDLDQIRAAAIAVQPTGREGRGPKRWIAFGGLAAAVVAVDQLTKAWLVSRLGPGESMDVVGTWLRFVHGRNDGGLFGLFEGSAALFAVASLVVIAVIVGYHARSRPNAVLTVALGLLLGGAIGNLIDRIRLGYVIDFVDAGLGDLRFYTFNVADSAISLSILLLIGLALFPGLGAQTIKGPDA
jgi:signal peptidase II